MQSNDTNYYPEKEEVRTYTELPETNAEKSNGTDNSEEKEFNAPQHVFRFKFTEEMMDKIQRFSKVHQFDDRQEYREHWEKWLRDNQDMIDQEECRMTELGCSKNIAEKMYKAGRYYFRNKNLSAINPTKRRKYIALSHDLLHSMDTHIKKHIFDTDYTPASGYDNFCETHKDALSAEICNIIKLHAITGDEMAHKIKKTYKNRYYIITHK